MQILWYFTGGEGFEDEVLDHDGAVVENDDRAGLEPVPPGEAPQRLVPGDPSLHVRCDQLA